MNQPTDQFSCLYVVEIARGRIKVGYTSSPAARLRHHRELAEIHGFTSGREWTSPPGTGTGARERELIEFCRRRPRSRQFRREYFAGVPFDVAVRRAIELCGVEWMARS